MRAPGFWQVDGLAAALLTPLGAVYAAATARRVARPGWQAPVPVICCGNATVGGAGKTTLALDLAFRLQAQGVAPAFLTRGYGGTARGPMRVDPAADSAIVGDEALLLAAAAPTYLAADRSAGARIAVAEGAQMLVMDDGLQNPTLAKDCSFLVVDGEAGFGNGRVIPAGPLREPVSAVAVRCRAAVMIGADRHDAARLLPGLPVLRAELVPDAGAAELAGRPVLAFAGIGRPEKFFAMLEAAGLRVVARRPFADHHRYAPAELRGLFDAAGRLGALPVTTPKDAARLAAPDRARVRVVGVRLAWRDSPALDAILAECRA